MAEIHSKPQDPPPPLLQPVTIHYPCFNNLHYGKAGRGIDLSEHGHCLTFFSGISNGNFAIADHGFPANVDGTHVFATKRMCPLGESQMWGIQIGWTDCATYNPNGAFSTGEKYHRYGCTLNVHYGAFVYDNNVAAFRAEMVCVDRSVGRKAEEIVSILTISENGSKKVVQWIVDGVESKAYDVEEFFGGNDQIFPVITVFVNEFSVGTISFEELKSTSPKIEELKLIQAAQRLSSSTEPKSDVDIRDDAKIIQQRLQVDLEQMRLLHERKKKIDELEKELENEKQRRENDLAEARKEQEKLLQTVADERQHNNKVLHQERESLKLEKNVLEKQLELERTQHQKTIKLLEQKMKELASSKESGQRRQREDENGVVVEIKQEVKEVDQEEKGDSKKSSASTKKPSPKKPAPKKNSSAARVRQQKK